MDSIYESRHFSYWYHLNSIRYHFSFYELTFPPFALADTVKIFRPFCARFSVFSRGVSSEGATCMIVESSMKQYPTIWKESRAMLHLKTALCPAYMIQFRRWELAMAHISGAAPFPWPKPCGGSLSGITHISHPKVLAKSPKSVLK